MSSPSVAIVTGAGSGIGGCLAELIAARGAVIIAVDVTFTAAARAKLAAATDGGGRLHVVEADVRDGDALRDRIAEAVAAAGAPQLVVHCAGVNDAREFTQLDEAAYRRVIDINVIGSRNLVAAVLPHLTAGAQLVLTASLGGLVANYGYSAYAASKFAVIGLAEVLRMELRPRQITVTVLCPPEVETPMVDEERAITSPATTKLKSTAGTLELDPACRALLAGIDRRRFLVIPSRRAQATYVAARFLPRRLSQLISDTVVARALR